MDATLRVKAATLPTPPALGRSSRLAQVALEVTLGRTVGRQLQTGGSGLMMQALGVGARVALQSAS